MYTFSVIIPVYNAEKYIEKCIESIPPNAEIVIVDDGSVDGTCECLDWLIGVYHNLVVIHQKNSGVSAARNKGMEFATGDYITFVDADDTVDTSLFQKSIDTILCNPEIDMLVYGLSFDFYRRNHCFRSTVLIPPYNGIKTKDECVRGIDLLFDSNCLSSLCTRIVKKSVIGKMKLREDMFLYEDLEFSLRVLNECNTVYFSRDIVYHYHQDEKHAGTRIQKVDDIHEITDKIDKALSELNCDQSHIMLSLTDFLNAQKTQTLSYAQLKEKYPESANRVFFKRLYYSVRHSVAEFMKYHIWFVKKMIIKR